MGESEPDWVALAGWSQVFARVLQVAVMEDRALALIDTNGDETEISLHVFARSFGGWRREHEEGDVGTGPGDGCTRFSCWAYGRGTPQSRIVIQYAGRQHEVTADRRGWWAFITATDQAIWSAMDAEEIPSAVWDRRADPRIPRRL